MIAKDIKDERMKREVKIEKIGNKIDGKGLTMNEVQKQIKEIFGNNRLSIIENCTYININLEDKKPNRGKG